MASWMPKLRALVSIALLLVLALTFLSAGEGEDDEEEGSWLSVGEDEDLHVLAAYALVGLAVLHMLLNYKLGIYELRSLLGLTKTSKARPKG